MGPKIAAMLGDGSQGNHDLEISSMMNTICSIEKGDNGGVKRREVMGAMRRSRRMHSRSI